MSARLARSQLEACEYPQRITPAILDISSRHAEQPHGICQSTKPGSIEGGRSLVEVALAAGISPETLRKIEAGRLPAPALGTAVCPGQALDGPGQRPGGPTGPPARPLGFRVGHRS